MLGFQCLLSAKSLQNICCCNVFRNKPDLHLLQGFRTGWLTKSLPIPPVVANTSGMNEADSTFLILSSLFLFLFLYFGLFMPSIDCQDTGVAVALCIQVYNHYVKECLLYPESHCLDVSSGIILPVVNQQLSKYDCNLTCCTRTIVYSGCLYTDGGKMTLYLEKDEA